VCRLPLPPLMLPLTGCLFIHSQVHKPPADHLEQQSVTTNHSEFRRSRLQASTDCWAREAEVTGLFGLSITTQAGPWRGREGYGRGTLHLSPNRRIPFLLSHLPGSANVLPVSDSCHRASHAAWSVQHTGYRSYIVSQQLSGHIFFFFATPVL
jgi:hypothetical protein